MNLASLSAYVKPETNGVCWNQMSDRPFPSVQRATVPTGYNNSKNNRHVSVTSSRPGGQTPGGTGCDIKHNSYDRYLNRLKGKGPLRRGVVPPYYGTPYIPFNRAHPIYGGKTMKTSIINGCDCPIQTNNLKSDILIYNDPMYQDINQVKFTFKIGQYVYAIQTGNAYYTRAIILHISSENIYTIQFDDGIIETKTITQLRIYYPCNCGGQINGIVYANGFIAKDNLGSTCLYPYVSF